jgi:hypothetical protein
MFERRRPVLQSPPISEVQPWRKLPNPSYVESIRLQRLALAKAFQGPFGSMIKALLGEAQFDAELAEVFRTRWITPQREAAKRLFNLP